MANWTGFLNINKPGGCTSRSVVDQVQWLVHPAKVGHAGTLDPLAIGVLVVCVGQATRLVDYLHQLPKRYRAEFLLGRSSPTEDVEGEVVELETPPVPSREEVEAAAARMVGEIQQRPPVFSALKVRGRRAYELARKGRDVELASRPVTVYSLHVIDYVYPRLALEIECRSGTYIRSLGRDLAESLETAAVMSALERTAIGPFRVEDAIDVNRLGRDNLAGHLQPLRRAAEHLPALTLDSAERKLIARGQFFSREVLPGESPAAQDLAALDDCGNLVAILRRRPDGRLGPLRNLASS